MAAGNFDAKERDEGRGIILSGMKEESEGCDWKSSYGWQRGKAEKVATREAKGRFGRREQRTEKKARKCWGDVDPQRRGFDGMCKRFGETERG